MSDEKKEIPLFPLKTVLFPGGPLSLRIFEPRYLDMISYCMKHDAGFGVVLIQAGEEAGEARFHKLGTLGRIRDWDRLEDGLLGVTALGEARFELRDTHQAADGLYWGAVDWLESPQAAPLPGAFGHLAQLLRQLLPQLPAPWRLVTPRYDDADWVGFRLAEILPISLTDKQALLEMRDSRQRLEALQGYLEHRDLLDEEDA
ncbi:Lon protease-like protein [Natronospira proteinivora]|uniref:Lon protease-like protein n=1 Tax=Natronospira proteinivora TaxID=1807133 RepID=A0ABT1G4M8_9GAMM|nr:Lon protease-like protein [Natronospira proteinivora]